MIKVDNISKSYNVSDERGKKTKVQALNNINISFVSNESYSIVGESGSGKSVFSRLLLNLEIPTTGTILYDGIDINNMRRYQLKGFRKNVKLVLQDSASSLNPKLNIYQSIVEPLRNSSKNTKNREKELIHSIIRKVGMPTSSLTKLPNEFSGGEQKRICIARAIITNPRYIIFDEAVSGLDSNIKQKILDLLIDLRKESNSTYIFITHDLDTAIYMSKKIIVMRGGRIIEKSRNIDNLRELESDYAKELIKSQISFKDKLNRMLY